VTPDYVRQLEPERQQAVRELTGIIGARYPNTEFLIEPGIDDPEAIHITAVVDLDDPDEVMDLVIDRLVELQGDAGLPISVIPIRTPARVAALLETQHQVERSEALLPPA
jgi:hypothetical protein